MRLYYDTEKWKKRIFKDMIPTTITLYGFKYSNLLRRSGIIEDV